MKDGYQHFGRCLACGGALVQDAVDDMLWWCQQGCTYAESSDPTTPGVYDEQYVHTYQQYATAPAGKQIIDRRVRLAQHALLEELPRGGLVADIGCGIGTFVAQAIHYGLPVVGYEPMAAMAAVGIAAGLPITTTPGELRSQLFGATKVVACLFDSLEHMERPAAFLEWLGASVLVLSLPCMPPALARGDLGKWKHYKPGEHIHYFGQSAVCEFLQKMGYLVVLAAREEGREDISLLMARRRV